MPKTLLVLVAVGLSAGSAASVGLQAAPSAGQSTAETAAATSQRALLDQYCVTCHNERLQTAGLTLDALDVTNVAADAEVWEKVVRKLRAGAMPPAPRPR